MKSTVIRELAKEVYLRSFPVVTQLNNELGKVYGFEKLNFWKVLFLVFINSPKDIITMTKAYGYPVNKFAWVVFDVVEKYKVPLDLTRNLILYFLEEGFNPGVRKYKFNRFLARYNPELILEFEHLFDEWDYQDMGDAIAEWHPEYLIHFEDKFRSNIWKYVLCALLRGEHFDYFKKYYKIVPVANPRLIRKLLKKYPIISQEEVDKYFPTGENN